MRLKWWGLYHDKPKVGTFMLRIKLPAGRISPAQLRTVGELSVEHGSDAGELSTRQTIQLHHLRLPALPDVFARLDASGLTTAGACGDAVRNVTGLPARGSRARRALRRDSGDRRGDELLLRQPGLQRPAPQAQDHDLGLRAPLQRGGDQLHRPRRSRPRRSRGVRRPRRRWALVGAAARPRARRLRREGRGAAGAAGTDRRVAGRPPLPRLPRQGAAEVHGRRHRPGGDEEPTSSSVSAARCPTSSCRRTRRRITTTWASASSTTGRGRSGCPCTSGSRAARR